MAVLSVEVSPFTAPNFDVFAPARHQDPRGVIVGTPLDGGQSYTPWIGLSTVRELALQHQQKTEVVDARIHDGLVEELHRTRQLLVTAEARVEQLEATQERIAGLVTDGFTIVKKVGRLPKKEES